MMSFMFTRPQASQPPGVIGRPVFVRRRRAGNAKLKAIYLFARGVTFFIVIVIYFSCKT